MKLGSLFRKNNHTLAITTLVLAIWIFTFIPLHVSLSQEPPKVRFSSDRVLLGLNQEPVVVDLSLDTTDQMGSWRIFDPAGATPETMFQASLQGNGLFFNATIEQNTVRFNRVEQGSGKAKVTIVAMRPGNSSELTRGSIEVIAFKVQLPKKYVSFVRERKVNVKLSTIPKAKTGDIKWYFKDNGRLAEALDKPELFSALITNNIATFRHKRQKYGEMKVTIVATEDKQTDNILAELDITVFVDDIKIDSDYISFYQDKKGKIPIKLDLKHNTPQGQNIKWYLLNQRGDRLKSTESDFFRASIAGNALEFEAMAEKDGESMVIVAATKTLSFGDTVSQRPQQEVNIAEKQIKVIVPSEGNLTRKLAKLFGLLNKSNSFVSLIINGGDIMLILVILFVVGLMFSLERIMFLFLNWIPGDMKKGNNNHGKKRTNLAAYAEDVIAAAPNITHNDPKFNENNPVARVLQVGVEAKAKGRNVIKERMEAEIERQDEEVLSKYTRAIEIFNVLAPMVGFFGTIVGLVSAFMNWTDSAVAGQNIKVEDLASGMYQAMITTAGGLVVAIVVSAFMGIILYRIRKFTRVMSDSKDQMLEVLADGGATPGFGGQAAAGGQAQQAVRTTGRKRTKKERKLKAPGIFALTDIVMNLFIFFFIAFNLIAAFKTDKESNIEDVSIPRTTDSPTTPATIKPVRVTIQKDETVLLGGASVTPAELTRAVRPALQEKNSGYEEMPSQEVPSVIIAADEEVEYDFVMEVLNAVKDSGLLKIGLTSIPTED